MFLTFTAYWGNCVFPILDVSQSKAAHYFKLQIWQSIIKSICSNPNPKYLSKLPFRGLKMVFDHVMPCSVFHNMFLFLFCIYFIILLYH